MALLTTRREALISGAAVVATRGAGATLGVDARWQALIEAAQSLTDKHYALGLQIGVYRSGRCEVSAAFGLSNLETLTRMQTTSVLRIGSLTKQFTAAGILRLVEQGRLTLDSKLVAWLPSFPRATEVTVRQLLNHTSGIHNYTDSDTFTMDARIDYNESDLEKAMSRANPLYDFDPGTSWSYSNTNYVILGIIIQRIVGQPLSAYLGKEIIERAGLQRTAVDNAAEIVLGRANGYTLSDATPPRTENADFISMTYPGGAGSLRSCADDLCQWHHALLTGRVISPKSLTAMLTPGHLNNGDESSTLSSEGKPPILSHYGFGMELSAIDGHAAIAHQGSIQGYFSWLLTYREIDATFAFLVNTDNVNAELISGLKTLRSIVWKTLSGQ